MRPVHRLAAALALLVLAGFAAAAAPQGPVPVRESACWRCHATWTPTLAVPTRLSALGGSAAGVGEAFQPRVLLQNAWVAEIRQVNLAIDLTEAPSLAFAAAVPPLAEERTLTLHPDPAQPTVASAATTTVNLTNSPSASRVRVVPASTDPLLGPRLAATLTLPDGRTLHAVAAGRGEALDFPDALDGQVGAVRIAVELPGLPDNLPAEAAAKVEVAASFEYAALRRVSVAVPAFVPRAGTLALAGLNLTVLRAPGPEERVGFLPNVTVHYAHHQADAVDWGNWTQETTWIPLAAQGGRIGLASTAIAAPEPPLNGPTLTTVGEAVGYAGAFLIVSSTASGGMFGKASRRALNGLFGSAKRRVAFHNFLSYGLILAALAHMVLFLLEGNYPWARGFLWGGGAMLAMLGLGVTGALQVPLIRRWGFAGWRLAHYGTAVALVAFTLAHLALEGTHFGPVQEAIHYSDPLSPSA